MSHSLPPPLGARPEPSRRLLIFSVVSHAMAGLAVGLAALPVPAVIMMATLLTGSAAWQWRQIVQQRGRRVCRQFYWEGDRQWHLQDGRSVWHRPKRYRVVWNNPAAILVHFSGTAGGPRALLLLADQLPAPVHRQLRVRLTLYPATQEEEGGT